MAKQRPRNPVARATLLRKGGVHQPSRSSQRQRSKQALRREARLLPRYRSCVYPALLSSSSTMICAALPSP